MTTTYDEELGIKLLGVVDAGLCSGQGTPEPGQMCVEAAICYVLGQGHGDQPACVEPAVRSFKIALNDKPWSNKAARAKGMRRAALAQLGSKGVVGRKKFPAILSEQTIRLIVPIALRAAAKLHKDKTHRDALRAAAKACEQDGTQESSEKAGGIARAASSASSAAAAYAAASASSASSAAAAASSAASYAADAAAAAAAASYAAYAAAAAAAYAAAAAAGAAAYAASDYVFAISAEICVQALIECGSPGAALLYLAPFQIEKPDFITQCEILED